MHVTAGQTPRSETCLANYSSNQWLFKPCLLMAPRAQNRERPRNKRDSANRQAGIDFRSLGRWLGYTGRCGRRSRMRSGDHAEPECQYQKRVLEKFLQFLRSLSCVVGRHRTNQTLTARGFRLAGRPSALQNDATAKLRT